MPRKVKDEYRILDELGAGGMATVYKAVQKSLDRLVAVKELNASFHDDAVIVQRFEREAKLGASFQHENIVHIHDYWPRPDFCIIMEYVDGVTLSQILDRTGPLPPDIGAMIAGQVANALEYAHMRGLIHRDIKPGNIMIKRNGEVKLMDFGIARTSDLQALTQPGMLIGTPSYMSPEQAGGQQLDARSDIFSLGVVLYEMFTGVKPFEGDQTVSITQTILRGKFISPRTINGTLPRGAQKIITKCLQNKPNKRYASGRELARALGSRIRGIDKPAQLRRISDFLISLELVEAPPPGETVLVYRAPGIGAFAKFLLALAVLLALSAAAIGYYYRSKPSLNPSGPDGRLAPVISASHSPAPPVPSMP